MYKEFTEISGMSFPKQNPLAAARPIRKPVYDPGPFPTATAWISERVSSAPSRAHSINKWRFSLCLKSWDTSSQ